MQYLLVLLVLAGCANSKQETPAAVQQPPAQEAPTNVPTALGARWLEIWGEDTEEAGGEDIPFTLFSDEYIIRSYLGENRKYRAEYAAFFQEQLELYGRNSKGKRIIDQEKLIEFEDRHPFSLL